MKNIYLSIIIPAFNEEERIARTLFGIKQYLEKQDYTAEVIVVSDGSTDKTVEIVKEIATSFPELKLIENNENHGKGYVTKDGIKAAQGKWILFMDADNSTDISQIKRFWPYIEKYEIIFASRVKYDKNVKVIQPFKRKIISKMSNWLIRRTIKTDLLDTQCGFKLFSKNAAKIIFPKLTIDRFGFDIEIVAIAKIHDLKIIEVPVNWINMAGSKVRPIKDLRQSLIDLSNIKANIGKKIY